MNVRAAMLLLLALPAAGSAEVVLPHRTAKAEAGGAIFRRPEVVVAEKKGRTTRDVVTMMASDRKFESGMYEAGPSHFEVKDRDYGVDEFMLFVKGGVTLTSLDGSVMVLGPGDAVTLPAEWRGTWDTKGYTKYYVVYSREGKLD